MTAEIAQPEATNHIASIASNAVLIVGGFGTLTVAVVKTWREVRNAVVEARSAQNTAAVAAAQTAEVARSTADVATQVSSDANDSLRGLVQQQGAMLLQHTGEFDAFREAIAKSQEESARWRETASGTLDEVAGKLQHVSDVLERVVLKMAGLGGQ